MRNGMQGGAPQKLPGGASGAPAVVERNVQVAAAQKPAPKGEAPKPPKRYRVMNGGTIVWQNCRTALRAGKEISDATYDVKLLRRQGIRLEPIEDDEPAAPAPMPIASPAEVLVPGTPEAKVAGDAISKEVAEAKAAGKAPNDPVPQISKPQ
jgi:hypothetical protein